MGRCSRSRWILPRGGGAAGRADRARAAVAEQAERVVAGVVAVGPFWGDGIGADQVEVDEPRLVRGQRRSGVEPAGQARLAAAEGARAQPAQADRAVGRRMAVLPLELEGPGPAVEVDADRDRGARRSRRRRRVRTRRAHGPIVTHRPRAPARTFGWQTRGTGPPYPPLRG